MEGRWRWRDCALVMWSAWGDAYDSGGSIALQEKSGRWRRRMNPYVRTLLSAATLTLIALYGRSVPLHLLTWGALLAMASLYLLMTWARQDWWTRIRFAAIPCLVLALTFVVFLSEGGDPNA